MPGRAAKKLIRCVLVDDHVSLLESTAAYLASEGLSVVGRAHSAADGVHVLAKTRPDVAIIDYELPDATGVELARALVVASPETRAVLFAAALQSQVVADALESGVCGVVLKESPPSTLLRAVRAAAAAREFVDPRLRRLT